MTVDVNKGHEHQLHIRHWATRGRHRDQQGTAPQLEDRAFRAPELGPLLKKRGRGREPHSCLDNIKGKLTDTQCPKLHM